MRDAAEGSGSSKSWGGAHGSAAAFVERWHARAEALWPAFPTPPREAWPLALCSSLALFDRLGGTGQETVTYYPEAELPSDPAARFAALFGVRRSWREEDLTPFVQPLAQPPLRKLLDLVANFCRVTNEPGGKRSFSKK